MTNEPNIVELEKLVVYLMRENQELHHRINDLFFLFFEKQESIKNMFELFHDVITDISFENKDWFKRFNDEYNEIFDLIE